MSTSTQSSQYSIIQSAGTIALAPPTLCSSALPVFHPSNITPVIIPSSGSADVLICGNCKGQYSEIHEFQEHKAKCRSVVKDDPESQQRGNKETTHGIPNNDQQQQQQCSQVPQIVFPTTCSSQISLPLGVPHLFLQSPSGAPQIYRLVLQPSNIPGLSVQTCVSPSQSQSSSGSHSGCIVPQEHETDTAQSQSCSVPNSSSTLVCASASPSQTVRSQSSNSALESCGPASGQAEKHHRPDTSPMHACTSSVTEGVQSSASLQRSDNLISSLSHVNDVPISPSTQINEVASQAMELQSGKRPSVSDPDAGQLAPKPHSKTVDSRLEDSSMTEHTLMDMASDDTSWQKKSGKDEAACQESQLKDSVPQDSPSLQDEKVSPSMQEEEEDVAAFLATQFRSHAVQQQSSSREDADNRDSVMTPCCQLQVEETPSGMHITLDATSMDQQEDFSGSLDPYQYELGTKKFKVCTHENCTFTTLHTKDMIRHTRKHTGEKPYKCDDCSNCFSRLDKLRVHQRIHRDERPYTCKEVGCSYRGIELSCLKKHMRKHTNERPYKCQICPYSAKDGSQLIVHLRSHTGDTPFYCMKDGCSAAFRTSSDLRRHERLHTGIKPFKCPECDYASAIKSNLKVHIRLNHSGEPKYTCQKCGYSAVNRKQLKEHVGAHINQRKNKAKNGDLSNRKRDGACAALGNNTLHVNSVQGISVPYVNTSLAPSTIGTSNTCTTPMRGSSSTRGRKVTKPNCCKNYICEECGTGFVREDSYRCHMRQHKKHKEACQALQEKMSNVFTMMSCDIRSDTSMQTLGNETMHMDQQPPPQQQQHHQQQQPPTQTSQHQALDHRGENSEPYTSYVFAHLENVFPSGHKMGTMVGMEHSILQQHPLQEVPSSELSQMPSDKPPSHTYMMASTDPKASVVQHQHHHTHNHPQPPFQVRPPPHPGDGGKPPPPGIMPPPFVPAVPDAFFGTGIAPTFHSHSIFGHHKVEEQLHPNQHPDAPENVHYKNHSQAHNLTKPLRRSN